jgi:hypothetical protein
MVSDWPAKSTGFASPPNLLVLPKKISADIRIHRPSFCKRRRFELMFYWSRSPTDSDYPICNFVTEKAAKAEKPSYS